MAVGGAGAGLRMWLASVPHCVRLPMLLLC